MTGNLFTFWHIFYNFLLESFEDKLWVNKRFKNQNNIWTRTSFESGIYLEESLISRITSLILLTFYNTWLIIYLIVLTKIIWILSAQFWWEFEELVAHGEGNTFCEKPSGFDKLININVKFHFMFRGSFCGKSLPQIQIDRDCSSKLLIFLCHFRQLTTVALFSSFRYFTIALQFLMKLKELLIF